MLMPNTTQFKNTEAIGRILPNIDDDMKRRNITLRQMCHVNENSEGDSYNDVDRDLFIAMRHILAYKDSESENHHFFFGTDRFEYVWQSMIDAAFGSPNKDQFFPKATWLLDFGTASMRKRTSLQPDSIMIYGDKYYVLDAKCYRYGWTENPDHLPGGPDINKQITYGEFIERTRAIPNERLFNAFILPYNKKKNYFNLPRSKEGAQLLLFYAPRCCLTASAGFGRRFAKSPALSRLWRRY